MRDIFLTILVFSTIPYILMKPQIGVFVWSWLGYMNPHRMTWGFAYNMPFAQIIMIVLLISTLLSKEKKSIPVTPTTTVLFLFIIYMIITTIFAFDPGSAVEQLIKVIKIQVGIFVTLLLIKNKEDLHKLLWIIVFSIGFFGIKGGVFTILTGGSYRVWGPPGGYIAENNALATALLMIIPLFFYLKSTLQNAWMKNALNVFVALCLLSAVASYSRGAFLALFCMLSFLWLKSPKKLTSGIIIVIFIALVFAFMPEEYFMRMNTIETFEEDSSAMERINAWMVAIGVSGEHFFGGGFSFWGPETFLKYGLLPEKYHVAHSIYFSVLGEHGYLGLLLFLLFFFLSWMDARWIIKQVKKDENYQWAVKLAKMIQVSFIAYATGGAFLSLSYFDLPYHLVIILVITRTIVANREQSLKYDSHKISIVERKKWAWEK